MAMLLFGRRKLLSEPQRLGRWGEKCCEKYLKRKGLRKLTANFSCKTGEIDLVMVDVDGSIVFVEVRTRATEDFASAESSITFSKRSKSLRAARYFLATNNITDRPVRFDVVTIVLGRSGQPQIRHYENAFVP